jgi:hypothetical protein
MVMTFSVHVDTFRLITGIPLVIINRLVFHIQTQNVYISDWHEVTFFCPFISPIHCGICGMKWFCSRHFDFGIYGSSQVLGAD